MTKKLWKLWIPQPEKVWIQCGDGTPKLLYSQIREASPSPIKQTKMDIYMEPKVKSEKIDKECR